MLAEQIPYRSTGCAGSHDEQEVVSSTNDRHLFVGLSGNRKRSRLGTLIDAGILPRHAFKEKAFDSLQRDYSIDLVNIILVAPDVFSGEVLEETGVPEAAPTSSRVLHNPG